MLDMNKNKKNKIVIQSFEMALNKKWEKYTKNTNFASQF